MSLCYARWVYNINVWTPYYSISAHYFVSYVQWFWKPPYANRIVRSYKSYSKSVKTYIKLASS